ncbi:hypothetical protein [Amaricoccus sp. W119]|uniref:hypothetical protein n=1 Tax=Amaricoccus sp. W119 TaxID=3391833 RepID=UPI0039A71E27
MHAETHSQPFLRIVSEAYVVEEKTVAVYARLMREAGLLTTGARGINAPTCTPATRFA